MSEQRVESGRSFVDSVNGKVWFAAALALVIGLVMRRQGGPIYDDPYILFRYADHLGAGHGWEFNRNTTSENAVTSSLMVLLLAGARGVGVSVVQMSSVLFFATTFGAAALTGLALDRSGRRTAGALAALLVASSPGTAARSGDRLGV